MKRLVTWVFDDTNNTLAAEVQRQDGTGSDVVWSTANTTQPTPWTELTFE